MKIHIIGVGPGSEDYLLPAAKKAIEACDCLIGSRRLLGLFHHLAKQEICLDGQMDKVVSLLSKLVSLRAKRSNLSIGAKKIAVLVSGDPGLYSLFERFSAVFKKEALVVIPGISAVQLAFARIAQTWADAKIISLHGRKIDHLAAQLRGSAKVFLFTDPDFPPHKIAARLLKEGLDNCRAVVFEDLSLSGEKIIDTDLKHLGRMKFSPKSALRSMIVESYPAKKGRFYGVGIGPGDPRLLTLRAKAILEAVEVIFMPKAEKDSGSLAYSIIKSVVPRGKEFRELVFPMTRDQNRLRRYWRAAAAEVARAVRRGKQAAFVTLGDPFIYSTYNYLLETLRAFFPDVEVETVPGISSVNAAAALSGLSLGKGDEKIAIVPVRRDLAGLKETLQSFETVVLMKVGAKLKEVIFLLKELNLAKQAVLVSRAGHDGQKVVYDLESLKDKRAGYLSVIIVKR